MPIHPQALVSPDAEIGEQVEIGPFAVVESGTVIGDRCVIEAAAQIRRGTRLGADCFVGSGALLGSDPQFRGFDRRTPSGVLIGNGNVMREYVTVHRSIHEGGSTRIGEENYLMAGAHVGHDSLVGHRNTLANNVLLAGHVQLGDQCFLGGGSGFHQFVRIGDLVMTQGNSGFSQDLPPYVVAADINVVIGINSIGLRRAGFSQEDRNLIRDAFRDVYLRPTPLAEVLRAADTREELSPALSRFYDFLRGNSKKGLCVRSRRGGRSH